MKTENFYKITIILLLLLNAGTLGFLWSNKQGRQGDGPGMRGPHPPRPDEIIRERLHLDTKQWDAFEDLKHEHHGQIMDIQELSGKLHGELFQLLAKEPVNEPKKDSLLQLIQQTNLQKETVTFEHFRKLRLMLNEEQKKEFDALAADISARIMAPHRPGR
jgi:periplasmic protein CpxP/Spy